MSLPFSPHVTVATVVERNGRFLLVEETINQELVINQPAGHWERGETLMDAALRETYEETGWRVKLTGLLGIYEYRPPGVADPFLRFAFTATPIERDETHDFEPGIARWLWMDQHELRDAAYRHRSPMVLRCVEDYWLRPRLALDLVQHLTPRQQF